MGQEWICVRHRATYGGVKRIEEGDVERLIDQETGKFTKGQYEGKTIEEVAEDDEGIGYLYFIVEHSCTDQETKDFVEQWLEEHSEYMEE